MPKTQFNLHEVDMTKIISFCREEALTMASCSQNLILSRWVADELCSSNECYAVLSKVWPSTCFCLTRLTAFIWVKRAIKFKMSKFKMQIRIVSLRCQRLKWSTVPLSGHVPHIYEIESKGKETMPVCPIWFYVKIKIHPCFIAEPELIIWSKGLTLTWHLSSSNVDYVPCFCSDRIAIPTGHTVSSCCLFSFQEQMLGRLSELSYSESFSEKHLCYTSSHFKMSLLKLSSESTLPANQRPTPLHKNHSRIQSPVTPEQNDKHELHIFTIWSILELSE